MTDTRGILTSVGAMANSTPATKGDLKNETRTKLINSIMALLATVAIQLSWIASLMVGRDVVTDTYPLHQHSPADRARKLFPLALLLLITVFALFSPRFFQFQNMMIIMQQAVVLLVTALGMTFIIIAGSIDLGGLSDLGPP